MKGLIALALAVTSGLLLALSLPPHDWEWLGWVALAPLLLSVQNRSGTEAAGLGLVTALSCGAVHVPWSPSAYGIAASVGLGDGGGTFFTRWGDWLAYLCLAIVGGFGIAAVRRKPQAPVADASP